MRPFEPIKYEELSLRLRSSLPENASDGLKLAAASGNLPLITDDLVSCLYYLANEENNEIRRAARRSLRTLPQNILETALAARLSEKILNWFAHVELDSPNLHELILLNSATADETFAHLGRTTKNERAIDIIARNELRLIRRPEIIEALQNNPQAPVSTVQRATELFRFQTGRSHSEVLAEIRARESPPVADELVQDVPESEDEEIAREMEGEETGGGVSEPSAETVAETETAPDGVAPSADEARPAEDREYVGEIPIEGEIPIDLSIEDIEKEEFKAEDLFTEDFLLDAESELDSDTRESLANKIRKMEEINKMRLALKGNLEARNILIKSANKLVQECVLKNPRITQEEVIKLSKDKTQREEIIRMISANREWTKNYMVIHSLCWNPKTPPSQAGKYLNRLTVRDLKTIARSKQVPGMLAVQARILAQAKEQIH